MRIGDVQEEQQDILSIRDADNHRRESHLHWAVGGHLIDFGRSTSLDICLFSGHDRTEKFIPICAEAT